MSPPAPEKKRGALQLLEKILKIVFFPFLIMVNPKLYFPRDEEEDEKRN